MAAQDLDADRMECAEPRHAFERAADQPADAFAHFARRLVRERHGEDLRRVGLARSPGCGRCASSAPAFCRCRHRPARGAGLRSFRPLRAAQDSGLRDKSARHGQPRRRAPKSMDRVCVIGPFGLRDCVTKVLAADRTADRRHAASPGRFRHSACELRSCELR